jgi:N-methylhydantoinase A
MTEAGTADGFIIERMASMRYAGQKLQELNIRLPDGPIDAALCAEMERRFTAEYARLYSKAALALFQVIEIFNIRVTARVKAEVASTTSASEDARRTSPRERVRQVYWPGRGLRTTRVLLGAPHPGAQIPGPAIVELRHTSISVAPGQRLRADDDDSLILEL